MVVKRLLVVGTQNNEETIPKFHTNYLTVNLTARWKSRQNLYEIPRIGTSIGWELIDVEN